MVEDYATIAHAAQAVAFSYIKCLVGAPEEAQQLSVLLGEIEHQCLCPGDAQQVDAPEIVEHPVCRGVLDWLSFLVWEESLGVLECLPDAIL
jgi:hypothetical protein